MKKESELIIMKARDFFDAFLMRSCIKNAPRTRSLKAPRSWWRSRSSAFLATVIIDSMSPRTRSFERTADLHNNHFSAVCHVICYWWWWKGIKKNKRAVKNCHHSKYLALWSFGQCPTEVWCISNVVTGAAWISRIYGNGKCQQWEQ